MKTKGKNAFLVDKNFGEILNILKAIGFRAASLSTYDFSTLYSPLPHNLFKEKLIDLTERTFQRERSLTLTLHVMIECFLHI